MINKKLVVSIGLIVLVLFLAGIIGKAGTINWGDIPYPVRGVFILKLKANWCRTYHPEYITSCPSFGQKLVLDKIVYSEEEANDFYKSMQSAYKRGECYKCWRTGGRTYNWYELDKPIPASITEEGNFVCSGNFVYDESIGMCSQRIEPEEPPTPIIVGFNIWINKIWTWIQSLFGGGF